MSLPRAFAASGGQRGAALVTVLILLVTMTLLGLVSMRTTQMEERMTGNQLDRGLAFQAAEAALREAESWVATRPLPAGPGCVNGLCGAGDVEADNPVWKDATVWASAREATTNFASAVDRPKFIVELIASGVPARAACTTQGDVSVESCSGNEVRYRITARSTQAGRAAVVLQSIYAVP